MNSRGTQRHRESSRAASSFPSQSGARPSSPLDKPLQYLRGVGPHRAKLLAEIGLHTVADLLEYFPFRHEEQGRPQAVDTLILDAPATVIVAVESVRHGRFRSTVNAMARDATGRIRLVWFNAAYMGDRLQVGQILRLHGTVNEHESLAQMVNPRVEWLDPEADPKGWDQQRMVPVYRGTAQLTSAQIAKLVEQAMAEGLDALPEILPEDLRKARDLPGRREAIRIMHRPPALEDLGPARRRLAYDELLLMQLAITLRRKHTTSYVKAPVLRSSALIDQRIRKRFPFALTPAQDRVVGEICADLERDRPMTRLLQGDVGSGKTVVALYAALVAVANRMQCAILAPTEVLASQHFAGIERYLAGSRVERCLLTGKTPKAQREPMLRAVADGRMNLVVGTQALLEKKVRFGCPGLVVVDEQHKFGVVQRALLRGGKSADGRRWSMPHYLVMTATPIPRTLSMTVFGDLDVSVIDKLPPGRQPIDTRMVRPAQETAAWQFVRRRIADGDQVYVVYPLVEESEVLDLKAATAEVDEIRRLLPGARVGLLHGRMKNAEKGAVMREFAGGRLDVLVSTTVIEVGVDVPNATVMVIQHAERYGLSALHQLRGRVGRGKKASVCLLMSDSRGELANRRLDILCETTDGFRIAEEDLRIRGPGELLGTRQHGWPEFRVANLVADTDLLLQARDDAARLVAADPALAGPGGHLLREELRRRFGSKVAFIDVA